MGASWTDVRSTGGKTGGYLDGYLGGGDVLSILRIAQAAAGAIVPYSPVERGRIVIYSVMLSTWRIMKIAFRVVTTEQLRDLLRHACLPFHTPLGPIDQYRLRINAPSQGSPSYGLLVVNMLAMIRASRRA